MLQTAEAAAKRQATEAEGKRQAVEAAAKRRAVEAEGKRQVAEAEAKRQAEEAAKRRAGDRLEEEAEAARHAAHEAAERARLLWLAAKHMAGRLTGFPEFDPWIHDVSTTDASVAALPLRASGGDYEKVQQTLKGLGALVRVYHERLKRLDDDSKSLDGAILALEGRVADQGAESDRASAKRTQAIDVQTKLELLGPRVLKARAKAKVALTSLVVSVVLGLVGGIAATVKVAQGGAGWAGVAWTASWAVLIVGPIGGAFLGGLAQVLLGVGNADTELEALLKEEADLTKPATPAGEQGDPDSTAYLFELAELRERQVQTRAALSVSNACPTWVREALGSVSDSRFDGSLDSAPAP